MDLVSLLVALVVIILIGAGAIWLIDRFLPGSLNLPAKLVVGILLLIYFLQRTGLLAGINL